jgi:hypothetical protein
MRMDMKDIAALLGWGGILVARVHVGIVMLIAVIMDRCMVIAISVESHSVNCIRMLAREVVRMRRVGGCASPDKRRGQKGRHDATR